MERCAGDQCSPPAPVTPQQYSVLLHEPCRRLQDVRNVLHSMYMISYASSFNLFLNFIGLLKLYVTMLIETCQAKWTGIREKLIILLCPAPFHNSHCQQLDRQLSIAFLLLTHMHTGARCREKSQGNHRADQSARAGHMPSLGLSCYRR